MAERRLRRKIAALLPAGILLSVPIFFAAGSLGVADRSVSAQAAVWRPLLQLHDRMRLALGADSIGNVYIIGGRMLRRAQPADEEITRIAAETVNAFAQSTNVPVYCAPVPTSAGVYADLLSENAPVSGEAALLRDFSERLSSDVTQITLLPLMTARREEQIYCRTDPRWTSYGAFCAYQTVIRKLGAVPVGYDRFTVTHFSSDYYGSLAQEIRYYDIAPDLIDLYTNDTAPVITGGAAWNSDGTAREIHTCYLTDDPAAGYGVFAAAELPVLSLDTAAQNNRSLLLLCDSFGAPMLPFLLQHYKNVTAVSLTRAAETDWQGILAGREYTQILILCGADTLAARGGLRALQP